MHRGRAYPQIVVQVGRRIAGGGQVGLFVVAPVAPHVHVLQRADRPVEDRLANPVEVRVRLALHAHLRSHLVLLLQVVRADHAGLFHTVGQRLLAVDVHPAIERPVRYEGVGMVRGAADDRVDIFLSETFAPVDVMLGIGEYLGGRREGLLVDVAQSDHVFAFDRSKVSPSPSRRADDGDVKFLAGCVGTEQAAGQDRQPGAGNRRRLEELPPGDGLGGRGVVGRWAS